MRKRQQVAAFATLTYQTLYFSLSIVYASTTKIVQIMTLNRSASINKMAARAKNRKIFKRQVLLYPLYFSLSIVYASTTKIVQIMTLG